MDPEDIMFTVEKKITLQQIINEQIAAYQREQERVPYGRDDLAASVAYQIKVEAYHNKVEALRELTEKLRRSK